MRILYVTQGDSLELFYAVDQSIRSIIDVEKSGFVLSNVDSYQHFTANHPEFKSGGFSLLKEWEVTNHRRDLINLDLLQSYENELGNKAGLFGAIVADRRLFMGSSCSVSQDYNRRFTDNELLSILQSALKAVDEMFQALKPDLVISFICVTIFDYLVYLFARSRGVRFVNIRATRIADRIALASSINDPSPELVKSYLKCVESDSDYLSHARKYIDLARQDNADYEGVVQPSSKPAANKHFKSMNPASRLYRLSQTVLDYYRGPAHKDNSIVNPLITYWYSGIYNQFRAASMNAYLSGKYLSLDDLDRSKFIFFPLHTEPEVSLLVYGRPFVNQLEIVRQIAISMPVDMTLVLKEHPWMVGKRNLSAYRKLLNIPRVAFVNPALKAKEVIVRSEMVSVITGSVALEAVINKKPVLTFGDGPFNILPDFMVKRCEDLRKLPQVLNMLLSSGSEDHDKYLEAYISAVFEISESLNLYSELLKKKSVFKITDSQYDQQVEKLSRFILKHYQAEACEFNSIKDAAEW